MSQNFLQFDTSGESEIYRLLKIGKSGATVPESISGHTHEIFAMEKSNNQYRLAALFRKLKPLGSLLIYPMVFGVSFLIFYTTMNFPSLIAQAQGIFASGKTQNEELLGADLAVYTQWINGYFYAVSDTALLSATNDIDKDGMTNHDEFIMQTNPTVSDSDGDGVSDGTEILNTSNLWGSGSMPKSQQKLRDEININMVSERISYQVSANQGKSQVADTNNFDLDRDGVLSIPKLKLQVPLIWSKDPATFDKDLQTGVIHYPGTALPGQLGTMYVSGHSSDYIWKRDKFATVFTRINQLDPGDDVFVTVYGKDSKVYNYRYQVTGQKVYAPDDQTQFIDNSASKINLSTCWPIGTAKDRMVVSAQLVAL